MRGLAEPALTREMLEMLLRGLEPDVPDRLRLARRLGESPYADPRRLRVSSSSSSSSAISPSSITPCATADDGGGPETAPQLLRLLAAEAGPLIMPTPIMGLPAAPRAGVSGAADAVPFE